MILYIDTTDFNKVTFGLSKKTDSDPPKADGMARQKSYKIDSHKSHETLSKLNEFLKTSKVKLSSIKKIIANKGPGSYTGVRVGVTHAQALGFALNVPVKFLAKDKFDKINPSR